jgi:translocation and assembly module TamA
LNKFYRFLALICFIPLLGAVNLSHFQISGVTGDVLLNVHHRLLELYKDKPISNEQSDEVRQQVEKALYPYGFFRPHISIGPSPTSIHILPGPQMLITSLQVNIIGEGAAKPEMKKAVRELPIKAGQPLNTKRYEDAKDSLSTTAENLGYLHAAFETSEIQIDKQRYTATIKLIFNTGPQYYFGQLHFDPTYISPNLLRRYVPFKPGDSYSTEQILALNSNLSSSGYFNSVNVKPLIQDVGDVPIDVSFQRVKRINYTLGAGYGTDTGPRGLAGLHVVPVNRYGHKFDALIQGSFTENALQTQYTIPGYDPMTDKYSLGGSLSTLNYNSGYSNALLLSVAQQHIVTNYQRLLSVNELFESYSYTDQDKLKKLMLYPKAVFTWSKTSGQLFSPSGYNITINGLAASRVVLSQINMAQASIDAKAALTFDAIRTRVYVHTIQGITHINNVDQIPLSLAQLLGGATDLKGYSYNSLGPGKILNYGGIELQKETFNKWYLVGFFDEGNVYKPSLTKFKFDIGVGLMWVSPIGPIKVGVAQAVDSRFGFVGRSPKLIINMGPDL